MRPGLADPAAIWALWARMSARAHGASDRCQFARPCPNRSPFPQPVPWRRREPEHQKFEQAFGCKEGDPMVAEKQCRVWLGGHSRVTVLELAIFPLEWTKCEFSELES